MTESVLQKINLLPEEANSALEEFVNFLYDKYVEKQYPLSLAEREELQSRAKEIPDNPDEAFTMEHILLDVEKRLGYKLQIH